MSSESNFVKCEACGKDVAKSAKSCPLCGAKLKKLSVIHWVGIGFVTLIVIGILFAPDTPNDTAETINQPNAAAEHRTKLRSFAPEGQKHFISFVTKYVQSFRAAKNELQQSTLRDQRRAAIERSLDSHYIESWVGNINALETNTEGKAILSVRISPDIEIKTWNNALSDFASNTLIDKGTDLYNTLLNLNNGQRVKFSGSFLPSETDYIEEASLTIRGSMQNPEFLFKFSSVEPIK